MIPRLLKLPENRSFFLFGARGTGKSTLLRESFAPETSAVLNLLEPELEQRLALSPSELARIVQALPPQVTHLIIDEVQKVPALLDVVHKLTEERARVSFVMTGSSARKLKHGGANLLAGRAVVRNLFPFSEAELKEIYDLDSTLRWGTLPRIVTQSDDARDDELRAYASTYLKEEIVSEQLIRKIDPFRRFLQVAAQMNGKILNYARVARDVGVDAKTIQAYYGMLEDTLVGFFLESCHDSVRKRLRQAPKFHFFDSGVARALAGLLRVVPHAGTSYYGELFEQNVVREVVHRNAMAQLDLELGYLLTESGVEVDLVVKRPDGTMTLVEVKSTARVTEDDVRTLRHFEKIYPSAQLMLLSNDPLAQNFDRVEALPWRRGLSHLLAE